MDWFKSVWWSGWVAFIATLAAARVIAEFAPETIPAIIICGSIGWLLHEDRSPFNRKDRARC